MKTIGRHLIAELYDCERTALDDVALIERYMEEAAAAVGATVVGRAFHPFAPHGVSGAVVIAESHLSIHTWPESAYVAVDIYTCGGLDPRPGLVHLGRALGAKSCRLQEIVRGLSDDIEAARTLLPSDVQIITRTATLVDLEAPLANEESP